jgi:predicted GNAT family N-acyltransferase
VNVREARVDELDAVLALRRAVFSGEQGFRAADAPDEDDVRATHLVAVDTHRGVAGDRDPTAYPLWGTGGGEIVGVCRLVPSDRTGRLRLGSLAVAAWTRGRGVGTAILTDALGRALAGGFDTVVLHANPAAAGLYERAGFVRVGVRDVLGTELWTMERRVA